MNTNDTIIINPVNTSGGVVNLNDVVIPSTYSASTLSTSSSFTVLIDGDYELIPTTRIPPISTMYYYARDHIPNYNKITTYPNDPEYNPNTNGVTNFRYAFRNMKNCKDSIGSIMNRFDWNSCTDMSYAFMYCNNLTGSIPNIPNNVTNMVNAFYFCKNLTGSIPKLPSNVRNMFYAFYQCRLITGSIPEIPNTVTNISGAFDICLSLTGKVPKIPNGITSIGFTFASCYNLTGPISEIPNSVTNMMSAFQECSNLTGSIPNFPNSVKYLDSTFVNCKNLTGSIPNIPNSVTSMSYTFKDCTKLSSSNVYIHSNNVSRANNCFYNMGNTMNIYVHANTKTYNSFYKAMGNSTYNSKWKCYLKTF